MEKTLAQYRILVVLEKGTRNYSAYAPEVPGCVATGKTREETLRHMHQALQVQLEGIAQDGDEMPISADPDDEAHFVEVAVELSAPVLHQAG
jgi:predicted RNase H-like HicB family nuclease